jgi:arylsulfatase A-like enzyme
LIITDDQGYGDLSLHGNPILETPNLDAIGLEGVRLDNFHVSPVCAPTRAAVLTGRRPLSTGVYYVTRGGETMDAEELTLAEILRDKGYATACFGKWHNGSHHPNHPLSQGFEEFFGFTAGHWNRYFDPELEHNGKMVRTRGYIADILTDRAMDFIREKRKKPFFCYLAYNTPHSPFQVPDRYFEMYKDRVTEGDSALRIMNASVYGMVKNLDDNVGKVMDLLRELGLDKRTIVVFLTDNGPNTERFNGHMKGRKGWVNDGGVRVPCFIRWEGHIPAGKMVSSMTAHIDLLPTLTSMMGVEFKPAREIQGVDLSEQIIGEKAGPERTLFTHVNQGVALTPLPGAVRTGKWRLVATAGGTLELTERKDAEESRNLADSLPMLADSMLNLYQEWFEPLNSRSIPPIPVGVIDSVVIPAHEGFPRGTTSYVWSSYGWANDWIHGMELEKGDVSWPLEVVTGGKYTCVIQYACSSKGTLLQLSFGPETIEKKLPSFIPLQDPDYNRIDRPGEAIGQTWNRISMGTVHLEEGALTLTASATDPALELLSVILLKK